MTINEIYNYFNNEISTLKTQGSYRYLKPIDFRDGTRISLNNKNFINLSSNDYLNLGTNSDLHKKFYSLMNDNNILTNYALGSTSSRLLTGDYAIYSALEDKIKALYGKDKDALVFTSGYHANIGILPALMKKGDLIISDKLNHASIIDGIILSKSEFLRYNHLDYDHLEEILTKKRANYNKAIIASESVFSMDGDIADIKRLIEIKNKFGCLLYVDEAHALGVFGKNGLGVCEEIDVIKEVDILLGTFGKAFASQGSFIVVKSVLKEYLINKMRSLIFTTALPPVIVYWNYFIFENLKEFDRERKHLPELSNKFRDKCKSLNLETKGGSQLIPIIIGDNKKTISIAEKLQAEGFLLFPIRPPTVPPNTSRIRISLTSGLSWDDIKQIPEIAAKNI